MRLTPEQVKGGLLVMAMAGVAMRSTMDIDTSLKNQNLSAEDVKRIIDKIKNIDLEDGVTFKIKEISDIMEGMEYPGIRIAMNAIMGNLITPMKLDISTGDVIIPCPVAYRYKLLLEDRYINLWSYNLETILAEKLQTILARGILNTRMRDFYDIRILLLLYEKDINMDIFRQAFQATCKKRGTEKLKENGSAILNAVSDEEQLQTHWRAYQNKYAYASDISFQDVMQSVKLLWSNVGTPNSPHSINVNLERNITEISVDLSGKIAVKGPGKPECRLV